MNAYPRILIFAVLAITAGQGLAADVGRVVLSAGDTTALRQGQVVRLSYGTPVQDQDTLRTGAASNLQVRFEDDSYIAMRADSELRVREFHFSGRGDGSERAIFNLLKGGMRAITGLIGRRDHQNYRMETATSTIGIRGTDYAATECKRDCRNPDGTLAKDGTYGRVLGQSQGTNQIEVSNDVDRKVFGMNSNFYVGDRKSPVESLLVLPDFVLSRLEGRGHGGGKESGGTGSEEATSGGAAEESRPSTTPPPLQPMPFVVTQDLNAQGTPAVVPLTAPNGFGVAYPGSGSLMGLLLFDDGFLIGTYNGQNHLLSFTDGSVTGSLAGGSIVDTGSVTMANGQIITWGRWTGATSLPLVSNLSSLVLTPNVPLLFLTATDVQQQGSVVGTLGGVATYTYAGGPKPVDFGGNVGSITSTSTTINFTTLQQQLAVNMNFPSVLVGATNYGSAAFNLTGNGVPTSCGVSCSVSSAGEFFGGLSGSCTGGGCASGAASGYFDTGLTGPNGYEGAAVLGLVDGTKAGQVALLNLYLASSFTPGPAPVVLTGQLAYGYPYPAYSAGGVFTLPTNSTTYSGSTPVAFNAGSSFGSLAGGSVVETGSIGLADGGTMNWGRWSGSTSITDPIIGTYTPATGVPFVVGNANTVLPTSGTFLYSFAGGPKPTDALGNSGTFTGGAFNVTFGSTSGSLSIPGTSPLTLTVNSANYSLGSCAGGCSFTNSSGVAGNMVLNGTCSSGVCSTGANVAANAAGVFVGPQGAGFAVAGNINTTSGPSTPTVSFAAGFKR
jgi:hypothetical protein